MIQQILLMSEALLCAIDCISPPTPPLSGLSSTRLTPSGMLVFVRFVRSKSLSEMCIRLQFSFSYRSECHLQTARRAFPSDIANAQLPAHLEIFDARQLE
jgi:hypothetical protein